MCSLIITHTNSDTTDTTEWDVQLKPLSVKYILNVVSAATSLCSLIQEPDNVSPQ